MPSKNPEIIKKHSDAWYLRNKDKQIKRQVERRRELRAWFIEYKKSQSCAHCKMSFLDKPECCDFHHLDPNKKEGSVMEMVKYSIKKAKAEMLKCICLCSNCHRTVHKDMNVTGVITKKVIRTTD